MRAESANRDMGSLDFLLAGDWVVGKVKVFPLERVLCPPEFFLCG